MKYITVKLREDVYKDLVRLKGWLQINYRKNLSIQDTIIYLLSLFEEKQEAVDLETVGLSIVNLRPGRKKKKLS